MYNMFLLWQREPVVSAVVPGQAQPPGDMVPGGAI